MNIIKNIFNLTKQKDHNYKHVCIKILGIKFSFKYKLVDRYEIADKSNKIYIKENGILREIEEKIPGLNIALEGKNNKIIIEYPACFINCRINCKGINGEIIIEQTNKKIIDMVIYMSSNENEKLLENRKVHIKKNVSSGGGGNARNKILNL